MKKVLLFATLATTLTVISCKKMDNSINGSDSSSTTEDNPNRANDDNGGGDDDQSKGQSKISYTLSITNTSTSLQKTTAGLLQWSSGFANPKQVKFEAKQGASEIEYKSANSTPIDLMNLATAGFGSYSIPAGSYSEIELKIFLANNGSNPALQLEGTFDNGTTHLPVQFVVNESTEIKTEQKNVTVDSTNNFVMGTKIDMNSLSAGIGESEITSATITAGVVVISSTSNTALYTRMLNNLKSRSHQYEVEKHHK